MNGLRESVLNFEDGVKAVTPQEVIELMMVSLNKHLALVLQFKCHACLQLCVVLPQVSVPFQAVLYGSAMKNLLCNEHLPLNR